MANCMQIANTKTHLRRNSLKFYAMSQFKKSNRCQILVSITTYAVQLVNKLHNPAESLIGDLEVVLIGANTSALTFSDPFSLRLIDPPVGARQQLFLPQVRDLFAFNCPHPWELG